MTTEAPFPAIPGFAKLAVERYKSRGGRARFKWDRKARAWVILFRHDKDGIPIHSGVAQIDKEIATGKVRLH